MFGQGDKFYKFIVIVSSITFRHIALLQENQWICMLRFLQN